MYIGIENVNIYLQVVIIQIINDLKKNNFFKQFQQVQHLNFVHIYYWNLPIQ